MWLAKRSSLLRAAFDTPAEKTFVVLSINIEQNLLREPNPQIRINFVAFNAHIRPVRLDDVQGSFGFKGKEFPGNIVLKLLDNGDSVVPYGKYVHFSVRQWVSEQDSARIWPIGDQSGQNHVRLSFQRVNIGASVIDPMKDRVLNTFRVRLPSEVQFDRERGRATRPPFLAWAHENNED